MNLRKVSLDKNQLRVVPEDERLFFIQAGNLLNELLILQKLQLFSSETPSNDTLAKAQKSQVFFITRILAGTLVEGWALTQQRFHGTGLSKEYEAYLTDATKKALKEIASYFGRSNPLQKIRSNFAFHFSVPPEAIDRQIDQLSDFEQLDFYIGREDGNCLYYGSHVLLNLALLEVVDPDLKRAMDTWFADLLKLSKAFIVFFNDIMLIIFKRYLGDKHEIVEIPEPPDVDDIGLPYFVGARRRKRT
jgi:hypothetical protein